MTPAPLDPNATPEQLRQLALTRPDLWPAIVLHPATPPDVRTHLQQALAGLPPAPASPPTAPAAPAHPRAPQPPGDDEATAIAPIHRQAPAATPLPPEPVVPAAAAAAGKRRPRWLIPAIVAAVVVVILAIAIPLTLLGGSDEEPPVRTTSPIAVGYEFACGVFDGTAYCWGSNSDGRLGDGSTSDTTQPNQPVKGLPVGQVTGISARYNAACAVIANGDLYCWGDGERQAKKIDIDDRRRIESVSVGWGHTCAIDIDGGLRCWGQNGSGQLGIGSTSDTVTPITVDLDGKVTAISAGYNFTCAIVEPGDLWCWGTNSDGKLGIGSTDNEISYKDTPQRVNTQALRGTVTAVDSGNDNSACAIAEGIAYCWGKSLTWTGSNNDEPAEISGLPALGTSPAAIAVGNRHACAITVDAVVRCWGQKNYGQLGDGETDSDTNSDNDYYLFGPVEADLHDADALSAGSGTTCARLTDGTTRCWGYGYDGQLGNGESSDSATPVEVTAPTS